MPDFIVHQKVAQRALEQLPPDITKYISLNLSAFVFGTQGPDFFYYRGLLNPFKSFKHIHHMSDHEHNNKTQELLAHGFNYVKAHQNDAQYPLLYAYWCGFLCHYSIDTTAHPLICELGPTSHAHKLIEMDLDAHLVHHSLNQNVYKLKLYDSMNIGRHIPQIISNLHVSLMQQVYGVTLSKKDVDASYRNMKKVLRLYHCPNSVKLGIIRKVINHYPVDISPYFYTYDEIEHVISDRHYTEFTVLLDIGFQRCVQLITQFNQFVNRSSATTVDIESLPTNNFLGESLARMNNG